MDNIEEKEKPNFLDFSWVKNKFESGSLYFNSFSPEIIVEKTWDDFKLLVSTCDEIFTSNWDIEYSTDEDMFIIGALIIRFPKLKIDNSEGLEHIIKDLFVRLPITTVRDCEDYNRLKLGRLQGCRRTLDFSEYVSDYHHSHLSTNSMEISEGDVVFNDFCLGQSELRLKELEINSEGITKESITSYFLNLISLVSYESLEGTPYKYIRNISQLGTVSLLNKYIYEEDKYTVYKSIINEITEIGVNFHLKGKTYSLINDDDFRKKLVDHIKDNFENFFIERNYLCKKIQDKYYRIEFLDYSVLDREFPENFIFRGKLSSLKIEKEENYDYNTSSDITINPTLLSYIVKNLNYEINKKAIEKSSNS